jgi:hypothetical protein
MASSRICPGSDGHGPGAANEALDLFRSQADEYAEPDAANCLGDVLALQGKQLDAHEL